MGPGFTISQRENYRPVAKPTAVYSIHNYSPSSDYKERFIIEGDIPNRRKPVTNKFRKKRKVDNRNKKYSRRRTRN